ncbi:MAG: hypothetical protein FWG40_08215 [Peptococcaceae bacterium]|nr:hypothetical protein [Peptococcaceae bacterium]
MILTTPYIDVFDKLCKAYTITKHYMLKAESLSDLTTKTYLQPRIELSNAYDHLMRGITASLTGEELTKVQDYLQGALRHTYRAFFDVADWCGIIAKEASQQLQSRYETDEIRQVIPTYFDKLARVHELVDKATQLREDKAIEKYTGISDYASILDELIEFITLLRFSQESLVCVHEEISRKNAEIERGQKEQASVQKKSRYITWGISITSILVAMAGILFGLLK